MMTLARRLRAIVVRVASMFGRERRERELSEEIESHIQMHVDDRVRAGVSPAEARRQAVLALGGVEQVKEQYRDRRGLPWLETLLQDAKFGGRMLRRQKMFTAVAVATLAIGFGPPIAIFTFANWLVLRPVPGILDTQSVSMYRAGTPSPRGGTTVMRISYLNLRDMAPRLRTVELAAFQAMSSAAVGADERPERFTEGAFVSGSYFDVLGVAMQAGRPIGPADDDAADPALVAVLSDGLWTTLFDRDPAAVGSTITVNGVKVAVIGIADREFQGVRRFEMETLWMPGVTEPVIRALRGRRADDRASGGYYQFVARLVPGASWEQADAEMALALTPLIDLYPEENGRLKAIGFQNLGRIDVLGRDQFALLVAVMFGASLLVLLIASSNVASLLLIRGAARRDELAVRRALGAGRWRVLRQQITETTLLWVLGALGAVLIVWAILSVGLTPSLALLDVPGMEVPLDSRALLFSAALALLVGVVFSLWPAVNASNADPAAVLQAAPARATRRLTIAPVLTVVQLSASLALLVGALMLGATVRNLLTLDLGFDPSNVTVVTARPPLGAPQEAAYSYVAEFAARLAATPGVQSVAIAAGAPFAGAGNFFSRVRPRGTEEFSETRVHGLLSPDYFHVLGQPLLRGRSFLASEITIPGGTPGTSAIVNAALARMLFGTVDVVGRVVEMPQYQRPIRTYTIVGVAADVRYLDLTETPAPMIYTPDGADLLGANTILLAKTDPGRPLAEDVESIARALGTPAAPYTRTLDEALARARGEWDILTGLMVILAAIASLVAAVGVYGVVGFAAVSRRAEFGVRMALGATAIDIRRQVLRTASLLVAGGLTFGLAGAAGLMQVLRARLVGVSPTDPAVWGTAAVMLVAIVAVASVGPARQAARASLAETFRAM